MKVSMIRLQRWIITTTQRRITFTAGIFTQTDYVYINTYTEYREQNYIHTPHPCELLELGKWVVATSSKQTQMQFSG